LSDARPNEEGSQHHNLWFGVGSSQKKKAKKQRSMENNSNQ
jgi:hypothetical protein